MQLCLSQTRGAVVNDLESDGTPKKNLSGYTSLLRLLLLSLITLSLWYSVGVGVSTCTCNFHIVYMPVRGVYAIYMYHGIPQLCSPLSFAC